MREQVRSQRVFKISMLVLVLALAVAVGKSPYGPVTHADPIKQRKANVNTCSKRELMKKVPGMTSSKAQKIINGRPYARIYDLVTKKVVTKKELSRIRDFITVKDP
jgi:DNA uptake protein ComE-like DNA-binding protein